MDIDQLKFEIEEAREKLSEIKTLVEELVYLCKDNMNILKALTYFNDTFVYGMKLETKSPCSNANCPTNVPDPNEDESSAKKPRGSVHTVPIQPALFTVTASEGSADQYFDNDQ